MKSITFVIVFFTLITSCKKSRIDIERSDDASDAVTVVTNPLSSFSCHTDTDRHGSVSCSIGFPLSTENYKKIVVMRVRGSFYDNTSCNEGINVYNSNNYGQTTFRDDTPSDVGESFSYRACVVNSESEVGSFLTSSSINALDIYMPANLDFWSCVSGVIHGDVDCSINFPDDISDYVSFSIRQISGDTAPNSDCISDGVTVFQTSNNFTDQVVSISTGANNSESFSYRLCIIDSSNNLNSGITISNIKARDLIAPPTLDGLNCIADTNSSNIISCTVNYPAVTSDFYSVEIRRILGSSAPDVDCSSDGVVVYSENSNFSDTIFNDNLGEQLGNTFSYRVCVLDRSNLSDRTLTQIGIVRRLTLHDAFSCSSGSVTEGNIDCTLNYATDTSLFSSVKIMRLAGAVAPNADCESDGVVITSLTAPYADLNFTDSTSSISGTAYSYRVCSYSTNGRLLVNNQVSSNVLSF
jgi:hypothetical protein